MHARIGSIAGLALAISLAATAAFAGQNSEGSHRTGSAVVEKRLDIAQTAADAAELNPNFPADLRESLTAAIERTVRLDAAIGAIGTEVVIPD